MNTVYSTTISPLPYPYELIVDGEPALAVNDPERLVVIPTLGELDAAAKPASPFASTVNTWPWVGVPPLSFRTTFIPGTLNLVILELPKVISLLTVAELGAARFPSIILF